MTVVFGAGGCAKEVEWLIAENNLILDEKIRIDKFIAKEIKADSFLGYPLQEEIEFLEELKQVENLNAFLAIANCVARRTVYNRLVQDGNVNLQFPSVFHHSSVSDRRPGRFTFGFGNIVCASTIFMPDVEMGNLNYVSLGSIIGHDTRIGSFVTIFPAVRMAGHVKIADSVIVGTGAIIIENIEICSNVIIGAGSVVNRNITEPGTYVGVPAKKIK